MNNNTGLPSRYRSRFTGQEIDELLAGVTEKMDSSIITTDVNDGSSNKVPAASITKTLHERVNQLNDPNYFLQLFLMIPDNNLFTDAHQSKLEELNGDFKGVYTNAADRAAKLDTENFLGGELTFLINSGDGISSFDYWDNQTANWKNAKFVKDGQVEEELVPVPTALRFAAINTSNKTACKFLVSVRVGGEIKTLELIANTDGINTYFCISNQIGTNQESAEDVMAISTSLEFGELIVYVTTKKSNSYVSGKMIAEI